MLNISIRLNLEFVSGMHANVWLCGCASERANERAHAHLALTLSNTAEAAAAAAAATTTQTVNSRVCLLYGLIKLTELIIKMKKNEKMK